MGMFDDDPLPTGPSAAPAAGPRRGMFDDDPVPPSRPQQVAKQQSEMSWPAWLGQSVYDFTTGAGDIFGFGMGARGDAALDVARGKQPDYSTALAERQRELAEQRERSPGATLLGNVAGGVATGGAAAVPRIGANIAARLGGGGLARFLGFGTEGAAIGAGQGAGHTYTGEIDDYLENAKKGAIVGGLISGGVGTALVPKSAVQQRAGDPRTGEAIRQPTNDELRAISDRGYQIVAKIPTDYPAGVLQSTVMNAEAQLASQNVPPEMAKSVFSILDRIRNHGASVTPAQIDNWRQQLNGFKNNSNAVGGEKAGVAANIVRDALDDLIQNNAHLASNPALASRAAEVLGHARANRAAMFRSQQLTDPLATATQRAATGGQSVGEQLVSKGNRLLEVKGGKQPRTSGWIPEERERLAAAITPTATERVANAFSSLPLGWMGAGLGGGAGGVAGAISGNVPGTALGGGWGAGVGATVGKGVRNALEGFSSSGIQRRWEDAAAAMRGRSPAFQRATQGAVPVAGPGMTVPQQAVSGGLGAELGTPYDDGREALAWSMMRGMIPQ